eukprot:2617907-Rhodomonas_salina.1
MRVLLPTSPLFLTERETYFLPARALELTAQTHARSISTLTPPPKKNNAGQSKPKHKASGDEDEAEWQRLLWSVSVPVLGAVAGGLCVLSAAIALRLYRSGGY